MNGEPIHDLPEDVDALHGKPEHDVDGLARLEMAFVPFHEACAYPQPEGDRRCRRSRGHTRDFHASDFPYMKWAIT